MSLRRTTVSSPTFARKPISMFPRTMLVLPLLLVSGVPAPTTEPAEIVLTKGDEPPPGPPWKLDYRSARREAIRAGRPVFVYFTKTY